MRILQIIQTTQNRGAETFACQLSNHLKVAGNNILIVSIFKGNSTMPWDEKIICLNGNKKNRYLDFPAWRRLSEIIADFNPDIIQANSADTLKYSVFSKLVHKWKVPIIFRNASMVSGYLKNSPIKKKVNKFFYKKINLIISVSQTSLIDFVKEFPLIKDKITYVPIGIENFKSSSENIIFKKEINIIHIGGFTFEKNYNGVLSIFQNLKNNPNNKDLHLHLIGDGPLHASVKEKVDSLGLNTHVSFHGFVTNPLDYINASDILILPSIIEGLPGVILEAMSCRTPVVAYNVGGIKEVVKSGETGWLVPKDDEAQFVEDLETILKGGENVEKKIQNAKAMIEAQFLNSKIANRFLEAYSSVLQNKNAV